ncbi:MAG: hypothetical protein NW205_08995 [Hyphomicrobiaceae bacterium]|nr:hypothetical protein [Hyphomicrobiaceae bacterium]
MSVGGSKAPAGAIVPSQPRPGEGPTMRQAIEAIALLQQARPFDDRPTDPGSSLDLRADAKALPSEAGPLTRVLQATATLDLFDRYTAENARALVNRDKYRWRFRAIVWANALALGIAAFTAIFLPRSWYFFPTSGKGEFYVILVIFIIALFAAGLATFLPLTHWQREWIRARGFAEASRKKLFEHITTATATPQAGELPAAALQLAYFERRQVAHQLNFFAKRIPEHMRRRNRALMFPAVVFSLSFVMFLGIVAVALAPSAEQAPMMPLWQSTTQFAQRLPEQNWAKIMLFLVIITILINGVLYAESQIVNSGQVARLYTVTKSNLEAIVREGGGAARDAAEAGGPAAHAAIERFVKAAHRALATDTEAWVAITAEDAKTLLTRET